MSTRWWSQPFPPEGGQTAEGIKKQLGRPSLDEYAVLLRESVQNSWDARLDDTTPVDFRISLQRLGTNALAWRTYLGDSQLPGKSGAVLGSLDSDSWVLLLSDRGTTGLGGPMRSDEAVPPGQVANFVQFLRNVGEPRDNQLGGGTYGFGKGILYRVSTASAIMVDSHNNDGDERDRRLMGACLGETYRRTSDNIRFTGRHWWGEINDDIPDPLTGEKADVVSEELGLPGFNDGRTGTDIAVIAPDFTLGTDEDHEGMPVSAQEVAVRLRRALYWHLWPKMASEKHAARMNFTIDVEGAELELPPVTELPVLGRFAEALDTVRSGEYTPFVMKKYQTTHGALGRFATEYTIADKFSTETSLSKDILAHAPVQSPYRHIARMRSAELVVDYLEGDPLTTPDFGYVGVFRASDSADKYFAESEPPTHDSWQTGALNGDALGVVRQAKQFINHECRALAEARSGARTKVVEGLGRLSSALGALINNATGTRATLSTGAANSGASSASRRAPEKPFSISRQSRVVLVDNEPCVEARVAVSPGTETVTLDATASVVLPKGKLEKKGDEPAGTQKASVAGWYPLDTEHCPVLGPRLTVTSDMAGEWAVRSPLLPNVAVTITVQEVTSE